MDLPNDGALRFLVSTYARLRAAHGAAIGEPALVQPTGEFFPDEFKVDAPSVARLLRRTMGYAPLADDLGVEIALVAPDEGHARGCGSLACGGAAQSAAASGAVVEMDDRYRVILSAGDVSQPVLVTTAMARAVGALVLHEAGEDMDAETSEVAAAACGFGVLLANGAAVWAKSCGGLRMARATALGVEEHGVLLALFCAVHGVKPSAARANLEATQREAFEAAHDWVESNPGLVESLRDRPALLEAGAFEIEPVRGAIGRWLHKRKLDKEMRAPAAIASATPQRTEQQLRKLEEARTLVDEVLG